MARSSGGAIVGLVDARGACGIDPTGKGRWSLAFTFAAWRAVGGPVVVEPRRCRIPAPFRSLDAKMGRIPPYSIVAVEPMRKDRDGATILKRIIKVGVEDEELAGVAAALRRPIVLVHPLLGRFRYDRRFGWYEGKARWDGRRISASLACADPDRPGPAIIVAERLFADQAGWKRRVDDFMVREITSLWDDYWRPEGEPALAPERLLKLAVLHSIGVQGDGSVEFWHSDGDLLGGHSIVVHADVDAGPTDLSTPG